MPSPGLPEALDGAGPGTLTSIYLGQQLSIQQRGDLLRVRGGKALGLESAGLYPQCQAGGSKLGQQKGNL